MNFSIDKSNKTAAYKQLYKQLEEQILSGAIKPGEKLPTERELEELTGLSRGTIKTAFRELQKSGKIITIQGSGSFVTKYNREESRKLARASIYQLLDHLNSIGITPTECEQLFSQILEEYIDENSKVKVAWIDCCEECLSSIRHQLQNMKGISLNTMLLSEFHQNASKVEQESDLIITTSRHFDEVAFAIPSSVERIEKVMLDLKLSSVIEIVKIPAESHVSLWSGSPKFLKIMQGVLKNFENLEEIQAFFGENNLTEMKYHLSTTDVLLVPPAATASLYPKVYALIEQYQARGGKVIPFGYQLNKGSLVYFEDRVAKLYQKKYHISLQNNH